MTSNPAKGLEILFVDNHLLGVYKPAGLLTQSDASGDPSLHQLAQQWIKNEFKKPGKAFLGIVHRLDRNVSGVVLFARTSKAASRLSGQFRNRSARKYYHALVQGEMEPQSGHLTHYLEKTRNRKATVYPREAPNAKRAELVYKTLQRYPQTPLQESHSLIEIELLTGRFHQIRAQLAFIKHPILGDVKYGASQPLADKQIALVSQRLIFQHPVTQKEMMIESPVGVAGCMSGH